MSKLTIHFNTKQQAYTYLMEKAEELQGRLCRRDKDKNDLWYALATKKLRVEREEILEHAGVIASLREEQCEGTVFVVEA